MWYVSYRDTHTDICSLIALGQALEVEEMPVLEMSTLLLAAERAVGHGGSELKLMFLCYSVVFASVSGYIFICECV